MTRQRQGDRDLLLVAGHRRYLQRLIETSIVSRDHGLREPRDVRLAELRRNDDQDALADKRIPTEQPQGSSTDRDDAIGVVTDEPELVLVEVIDARPFRHRNTGLFEGGRQTPGSRR